MSLLRHATATCPSSWTALFLCHCLWPLQNGMILPYFAFADAWLCGFLVLLQLFPGVRWFVQSAPYMKLAAMCGSSIGLLTWTDPGMWPTGVVEWLDITVLLFDPGFALSSHKGSFGTWRSICHLVKPVLELPREL